jgi:hypothetical protein
MWVVKLEDIADVRSWKGGWGWKVLGRKGE